MMMMRRNLKQGTFITVVGVLENVMTNSYDPYTYFKAPNEHPYKEINDEKKKIIMLASNDIKNYGEEKEGKKMYLWSIDSMREKSHQAVDSIDTSVKMVPLNIILIERYIDMPWNALLGKQKPKENELFCIPD
ncbi:hypothetical protein RCL_jg29406.t1 [Rhizophagus clarus]|uniref:Uncharacterized protein n=1 Tax=Rhizophagus clarus TaxID=94130 RepID=A0A8H3L310_9GLOM|nr:hypothetical protein RCL_jg29406.t1 [Rhizophagus clarus]